MTTDIKIKTATMDTTELREALRNANILKRKRSLPVLSYDLIEFHNGKAVIISTDLERAIRVEINSTNSDIFSILLPKTTTEKFLVGNNGQINIKQGRKPDIVTLSRDGIGEATIPTQLARDFPTNPNIPDNIEWHSIDTKWLFSMMRIIATACAAEESRPILTGVACNDGKIAATDGFRLYALRDDRLAFGLGEKQAIIPFETIALADRLFRKYDKVAIAFELSSLENTPIRVHFKSGNISMSSQLIQGSYPQYEKLIPENFRCKATFSAPLLSQRLNMIDEASINSRTVRYAFKTLDKGEQVCSITATIEDDGKYNLTCPVKFEGEEARIAFNHKYLSNALKPFSMCNLEITSESSPGKLTGDIEGLIIMIMPMFVQW